MPRIRTIKAAYSEIKQADPDTCLSLHALRAMVKKGLIPAYHGNGGKYLIDVDAVETVLLANKGLKR